MLAAGIVTLQKVRAKNQLEVSKVLMMLRVISLAVLLTTAAAAQQRVPVLVELFTSEGCSSCPPADALLAQLESQQPVANVDLIVLSEHVDYWNSLGWKDPFSAWQFTERQQTYSRMLRASDVYTPEAVIDGRFGTVGSRRGDVVKAITEAGRAPKPDLAIKVTRDGGSVLVELPDSAKGTVWVAVTQRSAVSQVAHGENAGRVLQHVGVVRALTKASSGHARVEIAPAWGTDLRVVAFVQDDRSGRILQAVQEQI